VSIITLAEAQGWMEKSKMTVSNLDDALLSQVSAQVLARIQQTVDTTGWTTDTNTPKLVRSIIAMYYVSWYYSRVYSEEDGTNEYALRLLAMAEELLTGITSGIITLPEIPVLTVTTDSPLFYPTDASSAQDPTSDDPSLGPAKFTLGQIF
jgi:hypothetical protein